MSNIARLWQAIRQSGQGVYQPALARQQLTVVSVETDSNGAVTAARGTIDGSGDFSVPVRGAGVRVGMLIGVTQPAHDPAAPLTFDGIDSTDDPSAGFSADDDADLPVPAWAGTPLTTAVEASPGRISSRVTAHFLPVSAKYKPSGYIIFYSLDAGSTWITMTTVDDDGSTAYAVPLSRSFEPGTSVEVKLRAVYKSGARSIASSTHTVTAAADTTSPGTATTVTVDNTVAGQLLCTVTASTVTASLFLKWRYEFSTSGSEPYSAATEEPGPCVFTGAAGAWYVRVAPVSKSGTVGTYTSWTGPTTLTTASAPLDTTAPAAWSAPTVSLTRVTPDTGGEYARLTVTLPARGGGFESDYARTIIRATNSTLYLERILQYNGSAPAAQTWENVAFGTWDVTLQAVDTSDNRSAASSAGSATLASSGVPSAAGDVTTTSVSLAVRLDFTRPTNALIVKIWRATSSGGAGAAVIAQVDGNSFIDSAAASGAIAGTIYYYKMQGTNIGGDGTISSTWVAGTVGAYDGANIAVNSVEANVLKASTVLTSLLKTAASGTRWELEGHTGGGNQDQFRAYENVSGTDKLRMLLNGAGLTFYDNSGAAVGQMYVSSGTAYISLHGVLLSATALNMGSTFELGWGSGGSSSTADTVLTRRAAGILGIAGDFVADNGHLYLNSARTRYLAWNGTEYLTSGANFVVANGDLVTYRSGGTTGVVYLNSAGTRYLYYDGSNYVMPTADLYVNGSIVLTSSRALKEQIRALPAMREKVRALTPKRFRRTDRPATRDEYGYIAEEVEAIAPHAVTEMDLTPPPTRDQDGKEVAAEPVIVKGINPLALLAVVHQGLSEGLAALEARVAALEARGGTP